MGQAFSNFDIFRARDIFFTFMFFVLAIGMVSVTGPVIFDMS